MIDPILFRPIGTIRSPFKEKFGTPRQPGLATSVVGSVVLREDLNPDALDGLSGFSHVWILFYFHSNHRDGRVAPTVKTKVHPPRLEGEAIGVFSTRSPHRPNPIGLSLVEIVEIRGRELVVRGLDMIDGTPVLDIKPYLPPIEAKVDAREGWTSSRPERTIECDWTESALESLSTFFADSFSDAKKAIEDIVSLDPRPISYRGSAEAPNPYTSEYGFRYEDANVVYSMTAPLGAKVIRVEKVT